MTGPTVGELFAGYGGLGLAVRSIWPDAAVRWVADIDPGPRKVLAHRYPDAPNLGDVTAVDWAAVEPVYILTGGSPCQDLSGAGRRAGMTDGTRSNLWVEMREAIATQRPGLVVWENVRGALSATADSAVEPCPYCHTGQPPLRALGRVIGDLVDLGYNLEWRGVRAADVGAAHLRFRVFLLAWPADGSDDKPAEERPFAAWNSDRDVWETTMPQGGLFCEHRGVFADTWPTDGSVRAGKAYERPSIVTQDQTVDLIPTPHVSSANGPSQAEIEAGDPKHRLETAVVLLPTPRATDGTKGGPNQRGSSGDLMLPGAVMHMLPTPTVNDMGAHHTPESWDEWTDKLKAKGINGNGHGNSLSVEALRMIPTPSVADALGGHERRGGARGDELLLKGMAKAGHLGRFGEYAAAIARQERATGHPAPNPTEPGRNGPRLAGRFAEWLMGLEPGWITDVPGVTRNEVLRLCGNGVYPTQAEVAIRAMLPAIDTQEAVA